MSQNLSSAAVVIGALKVKWMPETVVRPPGGGGGYVLPRSLKIIH